ncbi:MAG TPA: tetratricopeptide repeat protein, partial [Longimicrobium sp.]|nr:tetratricopeptide repeat protein [Longimicrobium sp.]
QAPAHAARASTSGASSGAAADLAEAKALCEAGRYDDAFRLFRRAAAAGSAEALGFAGNAYLSGEGTHPEPELGIEMLRDAAGKGDARSMITLATAYQSGFGVKERSGRWAMHWLRKAATEAGDAEAMRRLGVIHRDAGSDSALYWLARAVDAGSADARVDLGSLYRHGTLVPRDTAEAVRQYRAAAGAGSARGLFAMGEAHEGGFGVPPDPAEAHRWYLKAACAGSADAMNALGVQYLSGRGVPADRGEAERWFRRAWAAGSESAAGNLRELEAPERPRRWRGPVAAVLAWLKVPETEPPVACPVPAPAG